MKLRFLGLIAAFGLGSAAVLVYASQSREPAAAASECSDAGGCSACPLSAKPSASVDDDACCTDETTVAAPATSAAP